MTLPTWPRSPQLVSLLSAFLLLSIGSAAIAQTPPVTQLQSPADFITTTTTINFDAYPEGTAANTLYCSSGVEFRNVVGFPVPIYGWQPLNRITTSQPNVIATVTSFGGAGSNFLDLLFTSSRTEVGAFFGNDQGAGAFPAMTLSVFDAQDALIGSVNVVPNGNTSVDQFVGLRSNTPFSRARFEQGPQQTFSVVLDDVQFTAGTPPAGGIVSTAVGGIERPFSIAAYAGALYVADQATHRVWKVDLSTNPPQKTVVAGTGEQGFNGDGIDATIAQLDNPTGVAVDPADGTLYIADSGNHAIRKISLTAGPGALIGTAAGIPTAYAVGESTPAACLNPPSGFDLSLCVTATNQRLFGPRSVAVDGAGNLYIADRMNQQVKKLYKASGYLVAIAGVAGVPGKNDGARADTCTINCAVAKLNSPVGVAVDAAGSNVYVADEGNNRIRMISANGVSSIDAGTLQRPTGVAVSAAGDLYIADYGNHRVQRRSVANACSLVTVAGTGQAGPAVVSDDTGSATALPLNSPIGVAVDGGVVYIADLLNQRIRKVVFPIIN